MGIAGWAGHHPQENPFMPHLLKWKLGTPSGFPLGVLVGAILLAGAAGAATPDVIAAKSGCMACHMVNKALMGPALHDIAVKYKGDAKAPAALAAKVRSGSTGVWGKMKMLPVDAKKISDADLDAVIAWILKQ
jgi:cytochrome c